MDETLPKHRFGIVALAGRPNVGKSTLLNAIIGQKLSIVTPMPQTTRNRILAVHNIEGAQLVLFDTPGLQDGSKALNRYLKATALSALKEADVVILILNPATSRIDPSEEKRTDVDRADQQVLDAASRGKRPVVVAINKVDLVPNKPDLLPQIELWSGLQGVKTVVPISALRNDGVSMLVAEVAALLPEGPPHYPEETLTDLAERFFVAELVREAVIRETREEVPHSTAVTIASFEEKEDGSSRIEALIHVERPSQKAILIGNQGKRIKSIGVRAREEAERFLGCRVHLFLEVVVAPGWSRKPSAMSQLGYGRGGGM